MALTTGGTMNGTRGGRGLRRGGVAVKALVGFVAVAGLAVGGVAVMNASGGGSDARAEARGSMDLYSAAVISFDVMTTSSGELEAKNQIEIRNRLEQQSTIVEIVDEGKQVRKGDLLVKLNDDQIRTQVDESQLQVESARAEFIAAREAFEIQRSENDSALRQSNLKHELADLALRQWREGDVELRRTELRIAVEKWTRETDRLRDLVQRSEGLYAQGFLSKSQLEQEQIQLAEAEASLSRAILARRTYEEFEYPRDLKQKTSDLEEARAELERVERRNASELARKQADLENRRRQLAIRQERLVKAESQLKSATIYAPSDGLVVYSTSMERSRWGGMSDGPLQIGRQVHNNQLLISLPDTSEMVASVRVHEALAARVRPGQPATVRIDAAGGRTFTGRVASIGVLAESGGWRDPNLREYTVKIDIDAPDDGLLKPSMRAEAEIKLASVQDALAVPVQAVFSEGPLRFAYVASGGKFERRPLKIGRRSDRFLEVLAGLEAGERVLLRQPETGEILNRRLSDEALAAVGLRQDDHGRIQQVAQPGGAAPATATARRGGDQSQRPGEAVARTPRRDGATEGEKPAAAPAETVPASEPTATTSSVR